MTTRADLLTRGYFPKELPPAFTTTHFATYVTSSATGMPPEFTSDRRTARAMIHNLARTGTLRRRLATPNPVLHYNLCGVVEQHWTALDTHNQASPISRSYPIGGPQFTRALQPVGGELAFLRAQCRASGRYLIKADVARFYHSIYTHSLPWALHGKSYAKANRHALIPGNLLDLWVRNAQDGQTLGVPVGPDTSLVASELILSAVDRELAGRLPNLRGLRFMDDYELSFTSRGDAEAAMHVLQEILADYELALNPEKTEVAELPCGLEPLWMSEIRDSKLRTTVPGQASDLLAFFDRVTHLAAMNKGRPVVAYAIGRLRGETILEPNWPHLEALLLQWILAEPGAFPHVANHLYTAQEAGWQLDTESLAAVTNAQIRDHAPLGNGSEVAWALWCVIAFDLQVESEAAAALANMLDSFVALLAMDAEERGHIPDGIDTSTWELYLNQDELYGEHWLLAYEANIKGWLIPSGSDYVAADPSFGYLKAAGVSFYDSAAALASLLPAAYPAAVSDY